MFFLFSVFFFLLVGIVTGMYFAAACFISMFSDYMLSD